jgi:hypothetical protein
MLWRLLIVGKSSMVLRDSSPAQKFVTYFKQTTSSARENCMTEKTHGERLLVTPTREIQQSAVWA